MGLTIKQWENIIFSLPIEKQREISEAINTLFSIPEIKQEYEWTGLGLIEGIARYGAKR